MSKRRRRFLPEHVTRFKDRHGKWRYRFRRVGFEGGYFKAEFGTDAWAKEYKAFNDGGEAPAAPAKVVVPGSIADGIARYCAVPSRLGPTEVTQKKVRAVLDDFRAQHGHRMVDEVEFEHIDIILGRKQVKGTNERGRKVGGVHAARKLRKELVRLFDFLVKIKMRSDNPVSHAERIKEAPGKRSKGFHTWTEEEIAQYRARHAVGSKARLAMELMLWTGQRRSDAREMGPADIVNGRIEIEQGKTGKSGWISVAPQLLEAITAMPPVPADATTFLLTEFGKPFSRAGFGNKFREWCDQAGLPHCTAHGLRKAIMRRMAELDMGNQTLKSVSLHSRDDEVARYTAAANQKRMADHAIGALAAWEMSNQGSGLDNQDPQQTGKER